MSATFWDKLERLATDGEVVIERPRGSSHPRFPELVYPLDYGYVRGTTGGDGAEVDVWQGSLGDQRLVGVMCTVDLDKRDAELKLMLACTEAELESAQQFHERSQTSGHLIVRPT